MANSFLSDPLTSFLSFPILLLGLGPQNSARECEKRCELPSTEIEFGVGLYFSFKCDVRWRETFCDFPVNQLTDHISCRLHC